MDESNPATPTPSDNTQPANAPPTPTNAPDAPDVQVETTPSQPNATPNVATEQTSVTAEPVMSAQVAPHTDNSTAMQGPQGSNPSNKKRFSKKFVVTTALVTLLLLGASAAAYLTLFSKSPKQQFESALKNTSSGLEKFLAFDTKDYSSYKVDGSIAVTSPLAIDGEFTGQWNGANGSMKSNVGAIGLRVDNEIRTIESSTGTPDLYFKFEGLDGISGLLSTFGGPSTGEASKVLGELSDQWFVVDHTLIDQALAQQSGDGKMPELSIEEADAIKEDIFEILNDRFFTTDEEKAVFKINEEIGKEDFEGTSTYKLNVGINKQNLAEFLKAFEPIVKESKLKDYFEASVPGKSIDEIFPFELFDETISSDDGIDTASADVWVAGNGSFIRNVRFYPVDDKKDTNYLDFLMPYEGGDVVPLVVRATIDDNGAKGILNFGLDANQENGDSRLWFDVDMEGDSPIVAKAEINLAYNNEEITVTKPEGAKNILELVDQLSGALNSVSPGSGLLPGSTGVDIDAFDSSQIDDLELPTSSFGL